MRQPNEPQSQWLLRIAVDPAAAQVRGALAELLRLHYRYRFDPQRSEERRVGQGVDISVTGVQTCALPIYPNGCCASPWTRPRRKCAARWPNCCDCIIAIASIR